jgi:hypothetical protein
MRLTPSILALLALTASGCKAMSPQDSELFTAGPRLSVGERPSAVAAGDLDGDGDLDLLVANTMSGTVTFLRGDGTGGFERLADFPAGENPVDVALGDFDEDGDLDAAIANHETLYLTILVNDGLGDLKFTEKSRLSVDIGPHPHAVRVTDLDRDGHLDLLVDDREREAILVMAGGGEGEFTERQRIDVGGDPYRGMAIGDMDGDGWADLVTPNRSEVAIVLRAGAEPAAELAAENFREPVGIPAPQPFGIQVADLNGDQLLDVIYATEPGAVRVLPGEGAGAVSSQAWYQEQMPRGGKAIAVGDFNADGIDDAAIQSFFSSGVRILLGDEAAIRTTEVDGGENPWGIAVADLNGDGRDDLVVSDHGSGEVRIFLARP